MYDIEWKTQFVLTALISISYRFSKRERKSFETKIHFFCALSVKAMLSGFIIRDDRFGGILSITVFILFTSAQRSDDSPKRLLPKQKLSIVAFLRFFLNSSFFFSVFTLYWKHSVWISNLHFRKSNKMKFASFERYTKFFRFSKSHHNFPSAKWSLGSQRNLVKLSIRDKPLDSQNWFFSSCTPIIKIPKSFRATWFKISPIFQFSAIFLRTST